MGRATKRETAIDSEELSFVEHDKTLVVLLVGGDKKSQSKDIELANSLWKEYKDETARFQREF